MNNVFKGVAAFAAAIVIAAGGYFTKSISSGDAIAIATSPEKAISQCESILQGKGFIITTVPAAPAASE